jgi:hypothetical protein
MPDLRPLQKTDWNEVNIPKEGNDHRTLTFEELLKNFRATFGCTEEIKEARRKAFEREWGRP